MSALQPTKNPELIVNDFIQYAQSHLATVSGIVNTVSLYPPLGTPAPGVVQWTGYTVDGPQQSLNSEEEDDVEETGDDAPPVDGRDAKEHDERNNVVTEADETITPQEEQITLTREVITSNVDLLAQKPAEPYVDDPGDFPPKVEKFKAKSQPFRFGQQSTAGGPPPGTFPAGDLGPPPVIYGKVGASAVVAPPIFRGQYSNGYIPNSALVAIEGGGRAEYGGKYLLHPEAAQQYFKLKKLALAAGVQWTISSAYRSVAHQLAIQGDKPRPTVAAPGKSPHGWGVALDFSELYQQVGGSGNPAINKAGREKSSLYRWLSNNAPKFGWYNPYRLADGGGVDEMWHWEYWGFYITQS
jgi:hypothetical protein